MAAPMKAGIAPDLEMGTDYTIQFTALSPTDGTVVPGVTVSQATLTVLVIESAEGGQLIALPPVLEFQAAVNE